MRYRVPRSMILIYSLSLSLSLSLISVSNAVAENSTAAAQLSWSATNPNVTNLDPTSESVTLNLHLRGLNSFKGAEVELRWSPAGDAETGCLVRASHQFKTSSGTACTYLNRGQALPVIDADEPDRFHVSWANTVALSSCTGGVALQVSFDLVDCQTIPATFQLCSVKILDQFNGLQSVAPESLGASLTLSDGNGNVPSCAEFPPLLALADTSAAPGQTVVLSPLMNTGNAVTVGGEPGALSAEGFVASGQQLPPGATVDSTTAVFSWTPTTDQVGTWPGITITVDNVNGGSASTSFAITVSSPNGPPVVNAIPDTTIRTLQRFTFRPTAADPEGGSLTWQATGLPASAFFDVSTGAIDWVSGQAACSFFITLTASDSAGATASTSFGLSVTAMEPTFGVFQAATAQDDMMRLDSLSVQWVNKTIFPLDAGPFDANGDGVADPAFVTWCHDNIDPNVIEPQKGKVEVVLNVSTAVHTPSEPNTAHVACWPPDGRTSTEWAQIMTFLARRYNINDTANRIPDLLRSVVYWHVEEEASFLSKGAPSDPCPMSNYIGELGETRSALLAGNADIKTVLVGFSSDPVWAAANSHGYTTIPPYTPITQTDIMNFENQIGPWLARHDLYDVVDFHSYEQSYVLRGKVQYLQSKIASPLESLWVFEAGGPYFGSGVVPGFPTAVGYTDSTNAWFVMANISEALANGVSRYAWEMYEPGAGNPVQSSAFKNTPLYRGEPGKVVLVPKISRYAYEQLAKNLTRFTSVFDERILLAPTSISDTNAIFNMRFGFDPATSSTQVNVLWTGTLATQSVTLHVATSQTTTFMTRRRASDPNAVEFIALHGDSCTIVLTREPILVACNAAFRVAAKGVSVGPTAVAAETSASQPFAAKHSRDQIIVSWRLSAPVQGGVLLLVDAAGRLIRRVDSVNGLRGSAAVGTIGLPRGVYWVALRDRLGVRGMSRIVIGI